MTDCQRGEKHDPLPFQTATKTCIPPSVTQSFRNRLGESNWVLTHGNRRSAFKAVYLLAFLFAIFSLVWLQVSPSEGLGKKIAAPIPDGPTDDAEHLGLLLWLLVVAVSFHWVRLYITLEIFEDELSENVMPNGLEAWSRYPWGPSMRFCEFVLRCLMVGLIGFKAFTPDEVHSPPELCEYLFYLYLIMAIWGALYLYCQWKAQNFPLKRWDAFWYCCLEGYLLFSVPASIGFYYLPTLLQQSGPSKYVMPALTIYTIGLFLSGHLLVDLFRIKPGASDRNWRTYWRWVNDRVSSNGLGLIWLGSAAMLSGFVLSGSNSSNSSIPILARYFFVVALVLIPTTVSFVVQSFKSGFDYRPNLVAIVSAVATLFALLGCWHTFTGNATPQSMPVYLERAQWVVLALASVLIVWDFFRPPRLNSLEEPKHGV